MSDNEEHDKWLEEQKQHWSPIQNLTESFYYTYLRFENNELVAIESVDDFDAYWDYKNQVWACGLGDTLEQPWPGIEDWKKYMEGEDVPYPDTTWDGKPHPKAGELQHWEGMDHWYKVLVTNDVHTAARWIAEQRLEKDWSVVHYDSEDFTYEAIQRKLIDCLKRFAAPDMWEGNDEGSDPEAIARLNTLKSKGVSID